MGRGRLSRSCDLGMSRPATRRSAIVAALCATVGVTVSALSALGQGASATCAADGWVDTSDEAFAADCAGVAFGDSLEERERLAWMFFARVNQLIDDPGRGMSGSGQVPVWMAWPTDPDTFDTIRPFEFDSTPRTDLRPSAEKKDIEAGRVASADPGDVFYSEDPSWFWATFEFDANPGVAHVRDTLITQRAPLPEPEIAAILDAAGLAGFGFEAYAPNGRQIRFTVKGTGETPVILGHTDMEDFAGSPNTAQPRYWTRFEASCHSCHATASYNPETDAFFPFSVPTGALHPGYNQSDSAGTVRYLGQGYKPLDFMWPIAFQAR